MFAEIVLGILVGIVMLVIFAGAIWDIYQLRHLGSCGSVVCFVAVRGAIAPDIGILPSVQ